VTYRFRLAIAYHDMQIVGFLAVHGTCRKEMQPHRQCKVLKCMTTDATGNNGDHDCYRIAAARVQGYNLACMGCQTEKAKHSKEDGSSRQ
jgi:hypothetical protein